MKTLFRPARVSWFIAVGKVRSGERFRIEVDDVSGEVIAVHEDGFRRLLGLTPVTTRKIAKCNRWKVVTNPTKPLRIV